MSKMVDEIKDALDIREVMEHYGIQFNRRGYALCPFHQEDTASLSVKNGRFKCFGCGVSGDLIEFTKLYFGLNFGQALVRLNNDFGLGLTAEKPTKETIMSQKVKAEERRKIREKRKLERAFYFLVVEHYRKLFKAGADATTLSQIEEWLDENIEMAVVR